MLPTILYAQGTGCAAGYDCSERGVGEPGTPCGNGEWESLLVTQESGGNYTIGAGNSSALGRYQFINGTRGDIGNANNFPCASGAGSRAGFASCPGLQDDYARALWARDLESMMSNSAVANAVNNGTIHDPGGCPVTASGITALAHNVGPGCARLWAQGGEAYMKANGPTFGGVPPGTPACTDANGTNAVEKYACAMGGYDMSNLGVSGGGAVAAGCGFGYTPADPPSVNFSNSLIGCDPTVFERAKSTVEALQQQEIEAAKAMITQPTPVEQLTCFDQHTEVVKAATKKHSNKELPNTTIVPLVQVPLLQKITQFLNGGNILGSISSMMNQQFSQITDSFNSALGSIGGSGGGSITAPPTNCNMQEEAWLISQCIEMPQLPSLNNIIGGKLDELAGNIANAPQRLLEKVCESANEKLMGFAGKLNEPFDKITDSINEPLSDAASLLE